MICEEIDVSDGRSATRRITFRGSSMANRVILTTFAASSTGAAVTLPFVSAVLGTEGLRLAIVYHIGSWIAGAFYVQS